MHRLSLQNYKKSTEWYLRALWGENFNLHHLPDADLNADPVSYVNKEDIFLPENIFQESESSLYYRAAACHAAAHTMYGGARFKQKDLNLMQRSLIGLVEDLRVELLAIRQFPGLRTLWLSFHNTEQLANAGALQLLFRLSRSVLDPGYDDDNFWIAKGRHKILDLYDNNGNPGLARQVGMSLANDLGQMRLPLNSGHYQQPVLYRDDNRCLWQQELSSRQQTDVVKVNDEVATWLNKKMREHTNGVHLDFSHIPAKDSHGFMLQEEQGDDLEYRDMDNLEVLNRFQYPEWDYRIQTLKQNWCTLTEYDAVNGSRDIINEISRRHKTILARLQRLAKKIRVEKQQRLRKLEEGDEIDLDPMISAMVAQRQGKIPDTRVFMRNAIVQDKNLAISILLDLSESTNEALSGTSTPVYELLRDSALLLGEALSIAEERFAIYGFNSNGRHEVSLAKFKTFTESFNESKQRLSKIKGNYSTRLGTAIRYCADQLSDQPQRKKLLMVITDGVPSDIDVFDKSYLQQDCRHAVQSLSSYEIVPFCVNLDNRESSTIEHIFGSHRFETLQNLTHLPDVMLRVYLRCLR